MVESIAKCTVGNKINGTSYTLFVYADDIFLTSLTATGLQTMINVADKYITDQGLIHLRLNVQYLVNVI